MVVAASIFNPVARNARAISDLFVILLIVAAAIFVLVTGLLLYAVVRFRAQPGAPEPDQQPGNIKLEIAWTVAPALLLLVVFGLTVHAMRQAEPSSAQGGAGRGGDRPSVVVGGPLSAYWRSYGQRDPSAYRQAAARRLTVRRCGPQPLAAAARRQDEIWFRARPTISGWRRTAAGVYLGACSEFCGAEHAWMLLRAIAQPHRTVRCLAAPATQARSAAPGRWTAPGRAERAGIRLRPS